MFTLPFFIEWSFPYTNHLTSVVPRLVYILSWAADLMLVISLFVLGGAFWRKLQSLFIRTEQADFSSVATARSAAESKATRWRLAPAGEGA